MAKLFQQGPLTLKQLHGYDYEFLIGNNRVAVLSSQLSGLDYMYLYFLPDVLRDNDRTRIDIRYKTVDEAVEIATKIVKKKLYIMSSNILESIKGITVEK